ncbi:MAG: carbohydrate kinase family protein [Bifidobacterium crudilactis]|jgi:sugar/nucleoside kinase (ribokinase family)|nr:carbohydrate kinase family protein [Bifidobacterium crudilactis]MDN6425313.1 carbohydrate kinase family protein [Bifidobacterium crudilactis]
MDILGLGGSALDTIKVVDHLPIRDGFCSVRSTQRMLGGSGTNVLVQAQRLGARTASISKVADDADSELIVTSLKEIGVDTRGVVMQSGGYQAPHCLIYVDGDGEKALVLDSDGGKALPKMSAEEADLDLIDEASILYVDLTPADLSMTAVRRAKAAGKLVVFNMQEDFDTVLAKGIDREFLYEFLKYVDVFAPCQEGIGPFSGSYDIGRQIVFIRKYFQGSIVLTRGSAGVTAVDELDQRNDMPAFHVDVCDTTGAGDAFIGAFMTEYLLRDQALDTSLRFASACAALTCTAFGALTSPNRSVVENFLLSAQHEEHR